MGYMVKNDKILIDIDRIMEKNDDFEVIEMDIAGLLGNAQGFISSSITELEEKIERLKGAKKSVETEQGVGEQEIKNIEKPALENDWKGALADEFDESREAAYEEMSKIFGETYDDYQTQIQSKIENLQDSLKAFQDWGHAAAELSNAIAAVQGAAEEIEKQMADLGSQVENLRGKLFG